jgi:hypothetical protein
LAYGSISWSYQFTLGKTKDADVMEMYKKMSGNYNRNGFSNEPQKNLSLYPYEIKNKQTKNECEDT